MDWPKQNPRRPFGIGGGVWERWHEAGGAQVSRQGPDWKQRQEAGSGKTIL